MDIDEIENLRKIGSTDSPSKSGIPPGWTKTTLILQNEYLEKLKAISWWERTTIKDILEEILSNFLSSMETSSIAKEKINSLPSGWARTTAVLREKHLDKLKALALVKRTTIRDLLNRILEDFLSSMKVRPIPKEKKKLIE